MSTLVRIAYVEALLFLLSGAFLVPVVLVAAATHLRVAPSVWIKMAAWGALALLVPIYLGRLFS